MAKNYIEHEITVQFMEQYYAKGKEWQWFVDQIESDFEFADISTWQEYESLCWRWLQLYSFFEKMVEVGSDSLSIAQPMLKDLYIIAQFRQGIVDVQVPIDSVTSIFGKNLFWVVWATKLEKQDNDIAHIYDNDLFTLRNMWQSRSLVSMELYGDDLIEYGKGIQIVDIEEHISCLQDNINKLFYRSDAEFIKELEKTYRIQDLFGYQSQQVRISSWQEKVLVGLINNGLDKTKKYPIENIFGSSVTDEDIFDQLEEIRTYFSSPIVDFIIETVLFLWVGKEPSVESKCKYCNMWKVSYKTEEHYRRLENSGFWCVSILFAKGFTSELKGRDEFVEFINTVHTVEDIYDLQRLLEAHFPLSKSQKSILREYQETAYKKIDDIKDAHSLETYFRNDIVCKSIDTAYFCKVRESFIRFLEDESIKRLLPSYFYQYMVFLIKTKNMSRNVAKKEMDITIIGIQKLWEKQYYKIACQDLQHFSTKVEIPNSEVDKFNDSILENPLSFAKACMNLDEKSVCAIMEDASENALAYMVSRMALSKTYPMKNETINLVRHDVDSFLYEFISKIKEEKNYRFLNQLDCDKYLMAVYEDVHIRSRMCISMFHKEEHIYNFLAGNCEIKLLPYSKDLLLGHVTQLFPILEQRIREVSSIFGVAPFKEDLNSFMQFRDPSSLLREMIEEAYKETGNLELIYDLMFVYCFMYNSNSLNIRNECIHGRSYNSEGEIGFAFRVTLLSIYMMDYRIKIVTSSIDEDECCDE